ncbi:MAG: hypothetical protein GEU98_19860 [Pseudonocardiaceae bacterium]|nr:hypothetical protein [Pseudonocardiaceae bacterium]
MTATQPRSKNSRNGLYWLAMAVFALMVVLSFPFWLDSKVQPVVFGLPIAYTYHALFILAAVPTLWLLFKAIWPERED